VLALGALFVSQWFAATQDRLDWRR